MKLIIAGGRDFRPSFGFIDGVMKLLKPYRDGPIKEIVCGLAEGVDQEGDHWAWHNSILVKYFSADWKQYGPSAGPRRNQEMAKYGDILLLIWDGKSKGSASMKREMKKLNKPIYEVVLSVTN